MIPAGTYSLFHFSGCFFNLVRIWLIVSAWRFDLITVKPADQQFTGLVSCVKDAVSHTPAKTSIWISQLLLVQGNTLKSNQLGLSCSGIHELIFSPNNTLVIFLLNFGQVIRNRKIRPMPWIWDLRLHKIANCLGMPYLWCLHLF